MPLTTTGIDHINLQVKDLEVSCRFWRDLIGFEVLEDMPEHGGRIIGNGNAKLALYENPNLDPRNGGFAHVSFHIENFQDVEKRCLELDLTVKYGGPVQWPQSRSIYIDDPNGYEVELAEKWGGGL